MDDNGLVRCPRCKKRMQLGFAHGNVGLSFVAPEKLDRFASVDEDVVKAGLLPKILPWKVRYMRFQERLVLEDCPEVRAVGAPPN